MAYNEQAEAEAVAAFEKAMEAEAAFLRQVKQGEEARRRQGLLEERYAKQGEAAAKAAEQTAAARRKTFEDVTKVFTGLAGAVSTLAGTGVGAAVKLGSAASPGLGKAFGDAADLLTATIGQAFAPALLFLGAGAIALADQFGESAVKIGEATVDFVGTMAQSTSEWLATFGSVFGRRNETRDFLTENGVEVPRKDSEFQTAFKGALGEMIRGTLVHSGQGQPHFEGAAEAYKRIQQSEAGMTETRVKMLEINRKMLGLLEKYLPKAAVPTDDKGESFGGSNWG